MTGSSSANVGRATYASTPDGQTVWAVDIKPADIDVGVCVGVGLACTGDGRTMPSDSGCPVATDVGLGSATRRVSIPIDSNPAIPDWLFPRTEPNEGSSMPVGTDDFTWRWPAVLGLYTIDDGVTSAIVGGDT